uniref:Uncharacterized protein n=1 Tax=Anguilla anguilla TaxID=7936 RepID=A0A0E9WFL9_ANGAN
MPQLITKHDFKANFIILGIYFYKYEIFYKPEDLNLNLINTNNENGSNAIYGKIKIKIKIQVVVKTVDAPKSPMKQLPSYNPKFSHLQGGREGWGEVQAEEVGLQSSFVVGLQMPACGLCTVY